MKILYIGPLSDCSGYSNAGRNYVRALKLSLGKEDVLRTIHTKIDRFPYQMKDFEKELYLETSNNTRDIPNVVIKYAADYDVIINHTTPELSAIVKDKFNVNISSWETDRINKFWVDNLNKMNLSLVSCGENVAAYKKSGVHIPVVYLPLAFDMSVYTKKYEPLPIKELDQFKFKFYTICQFSKKKGIDALLKAYFAEFTGNNDVVLVMKIYSNMLFDMNETTFFKDVIENVKKNMKLDHFPKALVINENYDDEHIYRLHNTCDAYVLPSRAEGWSITHFDAMAFGKYPIAVNWGGPTEFIIADHDCGQLISYELQHITGMNHPVKHLYTSYEKWAEPSMSGLQRAMRKSYDYLSDESLASRFKEAGIKRAFNFSLEKVGNMLYNEINKHYSEWKAAQEKVVNING